jgi:hypothetical protein
MTDERNNFGFPCAKEETCVKFPAHIQLSELKWLADKLGLKLVYTAEGGYKAIERDGK